MNDQSSITNDQWVELFVDLKTTPLLMIGIW